jgi:hypothetical protein
VADLPTPHSVLVALTLAATLAVGLPASTTPASAGGPGSSSADDPRRVTSDRAARALQGGDREATLALRDLFLARPSLDDAALREADRLLARPTDGVGDPYGDAYGSAPTRTCTKRVCVHHVRTGRDAPPSTAWVGRTLRVMTKVWKHHVGGLGYRRPARDGSRGGDARFDVYLKDVGARGLYGYCAPERRVAGQPRQASGFCVLDDDFARAQFGQAPAKSLRVTAAHEFLHAIQFAYDFREDQWLLESTATWVEERFADGVDDNRAYLPFGQAARAAVPLDLFDGTGLAHYGNWVFWEYLSQRLGDDVVRRVLERTGTGRGLPDDYSTQALRKVLRPAGGLPRRYAAFAAANTVPQLSYAEGEAFPGVSPVDSARLRPGTRRATFGTRVDHLAAKTVMLRPKRLRAGAWRLRVAVDTPGRAASSAVSLVVRRADGTIRRRTVTLSPGGRARLEVPFSSVTVRAVSVTLANASTRYACDAASGFACAGRPLDQRQRYEVTARAVRG